MELGKDELRIHYHVEGGIDAEVDKAIEEALKPLGWHRWASGTDLRTWVRDLAFDRREG